MFIKLVQTSVLVHALSSLFLSVQGADSSHASPSEGASMLAPLDGLLRKNQGLQKVSDERVYSPSLYLPLKNGYIWFGLANTNGTVPQPLLQDPALIFAPVAVTSVIIVRFADGPKGPGDLVLYIVQSSLEYNGKNLSSGSIVSGWSSNPGYCNPQGDGLFKDRCYIGKFDWITLPRNCETLNIYDPADPKKLLLGFERICNTPPLIFLPNTSYYIPRLSPVRLSGFETFVPVTDGLTADGKPNIVDHVLGDFDMEVGVTIAWFDQITGSQTSNFIGFLFPVGFGFPFGKVRWGYNYISALQQSFAPTLRDT
eukprot:jgi/Botrbrau1/19018/Bobra.0100s0050.1